MANRLENRWRRILTNVGMVVDWLIGFYVVCGSLAIAALVMLTSVSVFWRYVLRNPISGVEDIIALIMVVLVAASVCYGALTNAHVRIDVLSILDDSRGGRVLSAIVNLTAGFALAFASYSLVVQACGVERACITPNLSIEHWPFYYVLAGSIALLSVRMILSVFEANIEKPNLHHAKDPN